LLHLGQCLLPPPLLLQILECFALYRRRDHSLASRFTSNSFLCPVIHFLCFVSDELWDIKVVAWASFDKDTLAFLHEIQLLVVEIVSKCINVVYLRHNFSIQILTNALSEDTAHVPLAWNKLPHLHTHYLLVYQILVS
jgi:hypothetical protein